MLAIQQFVILKDKEIKKQAHRVDKASRETFDLDGLAQKIQCKYLKFLQGKVLEPPKPSQPSQNQGFNSAQSKAVSNNPMEQDFGGDFPGIESSAQMQAAGAIVKKAQ